MQKRAHTFGRGAAVCVRAQVCVRVCACVRVRTGAWVRVICSNGMRDGVRLFEDAVTGPTSDWTKQWLVQVVTGSNSFTTLAIRQGTRPRCLCFLYHTQTK